MKKKGILALLLACSFILGTGTVTACNLFSPDDGQNQTGDKDTAVTGVALDKESVSLKVGGTITLHATVSPSGASDKTVSWSSDKPEIATVENGFVTAVAKGTAIITVTTNDGGKKATCAVTVTENEPVVVAVTGVILNRTSAILKTGGSITLAETVSPENATNKKVSWVSDKPEVATVVNGVVTAKSTGTAKITVTTEDGNFTAACNITVEASAPATVPVTGVALNKTDVTLEAGATLIITETVSPANATNKAVNWTSGNTSVATVDQNGKITAVAAGDATVTVKTVDGNFTATCRVTVEAKSSEPVVPGAISYAYAGNECAAFEWSDLSPSNAKVEYKLSTASAYTAVDKQLVRAASTAGVARVDVVGLKGGASYDFKITPSSGEAINVSDMKVYSYDRSGYAHFGKSDGVGAYNNDGTPKDNAVIVYVTEETKNTVKATVNGKERTGLVSILQNAGTKTPLIVRVIGTVGAATWNKLEENGGKPLTPDKVVGINGKVLEQRNWTQQELIDGGYNTLNTSVYSELQGLSSRIKYDSGKKEFDSCWNDCSISGVKNVTVEGIGEDARIFQWGLTFKSSNSVEVRNLTFEDYTEDACSFEGGKTSATDLSAFTEKNFWVHHNVFEEGMNYWDVCNEQDKHDGDGSTDFKGLSNVTISYNVYNNTHKTGLVGGSNSQTQANFSFHHNAYNNCKARLPLARQANMHMYNNYYNCTTGTDISLRANAYAFVENCYFETNDGASKNVKHIELQHDSTYGDGSAKLVGCVISQSGSRISVASEIDKSKNLYIGNDRLATVSTNNRFAPGFDTNSSLFYYDSANKQSDVSVMFTAQETKQNVPSLAGVQKRGVNVDVGGGDRHEHTYAEAYTSAGAGGHYRMATCEHSTEHTELEPHVYDNAQDETCNICGYVRNIGGGEAPSRQSYSYSYAKLTGVSALADNAVLSQENFTGDNAFLIIKEGLVTYRTGSKATCIQNVNDGISINFERAGTITIKFSSTGGSNVSRLGLRNAAGEYIAASNIASGLTAVADGKEDGCYEMTGTTQVTITFTVGEAGVYSIVCPNAVTTRGARLFAIDVVYEG